MPHYNHAYISDHTAGVVYRFALRNGVPDKQPDSSLYGGLVTPFGLAFDRRGYLYVSDDTPQVVNIYAPGAHGNARPIRQISFGRHQPGNVAVNSQGYLFVALDFTHINIYRPGAHGQAQPIHTIGTSCCNEDMLLDSDGRLYVDNLGTIFVYDKPLQEQVSDEIWNAPGVDPEYGFGNVMALDHVHHQVYIQFYPNVVQPGDGGDFAARRLSGASSHDRLMYSSDCDQSDQSSGRFYGAVISGRYLLASCNNVGELEVYYADQFRFQHLVEAVGNGLFQSPADLKLGP